MGDSACVLHAFSYNSSAYPHESNKENTIHGLGLGLGLGESVSFGRFMTEPLAWEKFSTFSHNRYVEEAERYARPGSVAQKKAFFEAHYKRIAAKKAAALLEHANANHSAAATAETLPDAETVPDLHPLSSNSTLPTTQGVVHEQLPVEEEPEINKGLESEPDFMATTIQQVTDPEALVEIPPVGLAVKEDSSDIPEVLENPGMVPASDVPQIEKPLLLHQNCSSDQDAASSVKSKKKSAFSSLKSSVYRKTSNPITPRIKKQGNDNYDATTTPIPKKKQQALDFMDNKKKSTPKSPINKFVNSTPVKQLTQLLSPVSSRASRKTDHSSRIAPGSSSKISQNCNTPPGTQNMQPSTKMSKQTSVATPCPVDTRTKTPVDGNKTAGPKWHILSTVCSKSLTACRNKLQSPTLSTPFMLRTEERAARRKQKLEEKFNSKDVEKVQLQQTSLKEKAESELRKLRQSFCFKARPLPDFYKEREAAQNNQMKKNPVTQPQSPKLGRKPGSRTVQATVSQKKNGIFKNVSGKKKNGVPASSSLQEMINLENASPNIQH